MQNEMEAMRMNDNISLELDLNDLYRLEIILKRYKHSNKCISSEYEIADRILDAIEKLDEERDA